MSRNRKRQVREEVGKEPRKTEHLISNVDNFLDMSEREDRHFCLVMFIFSVK